MKRILICAGVLGSGTALTFAAAALTATLFPNGPLVPASSWGQEVFAGKGGVMVAPMPVPAPVVIDVPDKVEVTPGP
jgi:hypothetical protein